MDDNAKTQSQTIAEKLRAIREELGLTQKEFATLLQVTPNSVARWERGELAPTGAHKGKVDQIMQLKDTPNGLKALKTTLSTGGGLAAGAFMLAGLTAMAGVLGGVAITSLLPLLKGNSGILEAVRKGCGMLAKKS